MTKNNFILAIDHGTSAMKTALFSARGELLGFEEERLETAFLPDGGSEQDPEGWWLALIKTSQRLIGRGLAPVDEITAVACSSTFSSTVAVGDEGNHLGPSLTWMDSRGAPYIQEVMGGFPAVMGYQILNIRDWVRRTAGGPQLSGKDDVAHVLFWKNEAPELYEKARWFLPSKDYLNLRLTGKSAASFDSIMLFWATDTRDVNHIHYDDKLIEKLGLDRAKLPPLKKSIEILGELRPEVADEIGLPRGVKVVMSSPDHQCAGVGSGAVRDFEGHIYIGTSSWVQCLVPFKKTDVLHSIASLPSSIPGRYYAANEQDIAGGALSFLVDKILFPRNSLMPNDPPPEVYKKLDELAATSPAGANRVIFTPWLNGERTPVDDTTLRAGFHNLSLGANLADLVRAVFEGVALNTRWALHYVDKFAGKRLEPLHIIGGGANSDLWCQIFADALGREIRQVQDPIWSNARGAAFIAAVALGHISFDDVPDLVKIKNTYSPEPENRKLYDERFREFLAIYKNNRTMYKRLNREK